MTDVITRIKVEEERIIPIGFGEALEYKFKTNFRPAGQVLLNNKEIVVRVQQKGNPISIKADVEIVLIKPNREKIETSLSVTSKLLKSSASLGSIQFKNKPKFTISDGLNDSGPGGDVVLPPPPPEGLTQYRYRILDDDPEGTWTIQIKNKGIQSELFKVYITHPDLQLKLNESKVPFSLLNRLLDKINRLVDLKIRIDNDLTVDFSSKFKKMLKLDKITEHIGTNTAQIPIPEPLTGLPLGTKSVDYSFKDINLRNLDLALVPIDSDSIALKTDMKFETLGTEMKVAGSNVNITKLEVNSKLVFNAGFNQTYYELRNLSGKFVASDLPTSELIPEINPIIESDDFLILGSQDDLNSAAQDAIKKLLRSPSTHKVIRSISEHLEDMLLFLASGKDDQVFFDIQTTSTHFIVRHYDIPNAKIRILHDHKIQTEVPELVLGGKILTKPPKTKTFFSRFRVPKFQVLLTKMKITSGKNVKVNPPRVTGLGKIEHIVVLTLENRSFDHMLGYLTKKKNRTDIDGLGASVNHTNPVPGTNFNERVFPLTDGAIIKVDPGHEIDDVSEQIANGAMTGFISNYMDKKKIKDNPGSEKLIMGFYDDEILDVFDFLAEEYLVCDRWFSSHPGATYPNRFISLMGSAPSIRNFEIGGIEAGTVKGKNIFDILTEKNVSWKYVESNIAFLRMFDKYRVDETNIVQRKEWLSMAKTGQLPAVSWIDPHIVDLEIEGEADDDHPPANVKKGQQGVREIYEALKTNPEQWAKTMFIITYDEHGGFYDHVPPHGINGETNPVVHKIHEDGEEFYGLRVPTFVISPLVKPRSVSSTVFDHTSILKTILLNFVGREAVRKEILGKRVDAANSLLEVLDSRPRADVNKMANPKIGTINSEKKSINDREVQFDSFHDNMLLFGFGPKFRRKVNEEIQKR